MEPDTLDVRGVPMRWTAHGSGHAVVFIHGIPDHPDRIADAIHAVIRSA